MVSYDQSNGDIVVNGWEKGIFPSPNDGLGDIKCANIATIPGEVMCNFSRQVQTNPTNAYGTITTVSASGSNFPYVFTSGAPTSGYALAGGWVTVTGSTITGLSNGDYYILSATQTGAKTMQLAATFKGAAISWSSTGSATIDFNAYRMTAAIQGCTEKYTDANNVAQYRYYILDNRALVWMKDTGDTTTGLTWALISIVSAKSAPTDTATGIAVYNGYLLVFASHYIFYKHTSNLGVDISTGTANQWDSMTTLPLNTPYKSPNPHTAFVGHQSSLYWCDGNYLGSIFATAGVPNVWSYATYTFDGVNPDLTIRVIGGNTPYIGMPITFMTSTGNSHVPTGFNATATFYVVAVSSTTSATTIQVSSTAGGVAITPTGGTGTQYFNTFNPAIVTTFTFSSQALTLPNDEVSQSIAEIGNTVIVGTKSNILYPWDQVSAQPSGLIFLPEANVTNMITVNNMAYILAGSKGNIYISNGSTASRALTIPDYISGMIEPYFVWGGLMYLRGRIWFSAQDQTATHTGNCGGIWSFVPVQNFFIGEDIGLALRLENQNSYGTYNGLATVLIPDQNQNSVGAQYFSAWTSEISSPTYGIDGSGTSPYTGGQTIIETDLIPIGNYVERGNFSNVMTKYNAPLVSGESVQIQWRSDLTSSWTNIGTDNTVGSVGLRFPASFANKMLIQLKIILTSTATSPSFVRFSELRLKK